MEVFVGYAVISLMGVCLGMIGAGGSILALPALVYLFQIEPTLATTYTSFLVGITAAAGALKSLITRNINLLALLSFGIPCMVGAYLARVCLTTIIPDVIVSSSIFNLTRDAFVMSLFSITMLLAGLSMLSRRNHESPSKPDYRWLLPIGLVVGMITGIVGAGGGFLILPSLIILGGVEISCAVGTSLTIIAIKALSSAIGDMTTGLQMNFVLMASLMMVAIPGVLVGRCLSVHVKAHKLKAGFGLAVSVTGAAIGVHQLVVILAV